MAESDLVAAIPDSSGTVAVLIPVFNDDGRLPATLASLDAQGVPLVAVVVDDGSATPVSIDRRRYRFEIVLLRHPTNGGIERALNTGLEYITRRGFEYIARLDNGDRCAPGRLARQRALLERDRSVDLVGSAVEWRDRSERVRFIRTFPTTHEVIVRALHHTAALVHPAVMFRASLVESVGAYSTAYPAAEDYEFFLRIARRHRVANLPDTLLVARFDPDGISMKRRRTQLRSTLRAQLSYFQPIFWTSYYGVLKTLGKFVIPYSWLVTAKAAMSRGVPAP